MFSPESWRAEPPEKKEVCFYCMAFSSMLCILLGGGGPVALHGVVSGLAESLVIGYRVLGFRAWGIGFRCGERGSGTEA